MYTSSRIKRHQSVTHPHSLHLKGNPFEQQHELLNFTKSVIDLEAEIPHTPWSPSRKIIPEKCTPLQLNHSDVLDHPEHWNANLTKNKIPEDSATMIEPEMMIRAASDGQKEAIDAPTSTDENPFCSIQLSRVYFSQQNTNGSHSFQVATSPVTHQTTTTSNIEKPSPKRRKVTFNENITRRSITNTHRLHSSPDTPNLKGLFQKSASKAPKKSNISGNQYVYFLSDNRQRIKSDNSKDNGKRTGLNHSLKRNELESSNSPTRASVTQTNRISSGEEEDDLQMQVVVDGDGRVLVKNVLNPCAAKSKCTETLPNNNLNHVQIKADLNSNIIGDDPEYFLQQKETVTLVRNETHRQRYSYSKRKIDGSYTTSIDNPIHFNHADIHMKRDQFNNTCLHDHDFYERKATTNRPNTYYPYQKTLGRRHVADVTTNNQYLRSAKVPVSNYNMTVNNSMHDINLNEHNKGQSMRNSLSVSRFVEKDNSCDVCSTTGNLIKTSYKSHANSEDKSKNPIQTKKHTPTAGEYCIGSDNHAMLSKNPQQQRSQLEGSTISHYRGRPHCGPQTVINANGNQVEPTNNSKSHHGNDKCLDSNGTDKAHDEELRYKCDWPACTKSFRHYSFLVLHRRIHTGERPYNCTWEGCKKQFRRSDDYQRHYRVHTGVKPYPCEVCGKAFKRSDHRLFHYRAIHNMHK